MEWSQRDIESEARFGSPHARLFAYLGQTVSTPGGPAKLVQVFKNRAAVIVAGSKVLTFWHPNLIEPAE